VKDTNIDYAKQTLEQAGFVVNIITKENNGDYTEGLVAEITPAEGTSKTKGTDVFVQVWGAPPSTEPDTETTTEKNPFYNPFF
jgi:beta-lactam-binding protein with PASTA domain